jgi:hypothetical protein
MRTPYFINTVLDLLAESYGASTWEGRQGV